jgi:hypothetical protein
MAYTHTALTGNWYFVTLSSQGTGSRWFCAPIVQRTTLATGYLMFLDIFNFTNTAVIFETGGVFSGTNIIDLNDYAGSSVGTITPNGTWTAVAGLDLVVVTGTPTTDENVFEDLANTHAAYVDHTLQSILTLTCAVVIGDPLQVAVTQCESRRESVHIEGGLWVAGNDTYDTDLDIGDGVIDELGTSRNGSVITTEEVNAQWAWLGSTLYGRVTAFASVFNCARMGWQNTLQRCSFSGVPDLPTVAVENGFLQLDSQRMLFSASDIMLWRDISCRVQLLMRTIQTDFVGVDITTPSGTECIYFRLFQEMTFRGLTLFQEGGGAVITSQFAQGLKTWIDCFFDEDNMIIGLSNWPNSFFYTTNMRVTNKDGTPIQGALVRLWAAGLTPGVDAFTWSATTDVNGDIPAQLTPSVTVLANANPPPLTELRPATVFVTLDGWLEDQFQLSVEAPVGLIRPLRDANYASLEA